jgi:glycosyltransferase involved in cell wall biosynthesis
VLQVSSIVPFLKHFTSARIVFYGHFPDLLLAQHSTGLRRMYRAPFDRLEGSSTAAADLLLVNSNFTRDTFCDTFPALRERVGIRVLYPAVAVPSDKQLAQEQTEWESGATRSRRGGWERARSCAPRRDTAHACAVLEPDLVEWIRGGSMLLSLNRFERKKNVALALRALREVIDRHSLSSGACARARLVVAGGHDPRVRENVAHFRELQALARTLDLEDRVVFMKNITEAQRCAAAAPPASLAAIHRRFPL